MYGALRGVNDYRQTYYGALNLYHRDFVLMPHDGGNSKNTVAFIKYLQNLNPDKKLILIWDGASYHRSEEVRAYLNQVNEDLEEKTGKLLVYYLHRMLPNKTQLKMCG